MTALAQGRHEEALNIVKKDGMAEAEDVVLTAQAELAYNQGNLTESALKYAKTKAGFEEVTLKFVDLEDKRALKLYLRKKLEALDSRDATQITLLVIWLIEIYQNELGRLREGGAVPEENREQYQKVNDQFERDILEDPKVRECISHNKEVVYSLLGSHGDTQSLVTIASQLRDQERVVQYSLQEGKHQEVSHKIFKYYQNNVFCVNIPIM